jgi:hypothetical protein
VWLIYYGALVLGAVVLLWARRWTTVIYNVDAAGLESALAECLGRLGVVWSRHGNRLVLSPEVEPGGPAPLPRADPTGGDPVILDVEPAVRRGQAVGAGRPGVIDYFRRRAFPSPADSPPGDSS